MLPIETMPLTQVVEDFNAEIELRETSLIMEAVQHFDNTINRFRRGSTLDFDERYFFLEKAAQEVVTKTSNPFICSRKYYVDGQFYCWEVYRFKL